MKKQRKKKKVKDVSLMKSANLDVASIILKTRYLRVLAQKTKINTNATNIMMIDEESFLKCSTFENIFLFSLFRFSALFWIPAIHSIYAAFMFIYNRHNIEIQYIHNCINVS